MIETAWLIQVLFQLDSPLAVTVTDNKPVYNQLCSFFALSIIKLTFFPFELY